MTFHAIIIIIFYYFCALLSRILNLKIFRFIFDHCSLSSTTSNNYISLLYGLADINYNKSIEFNDYYRRIITNKKHPNKKKSSMRKCRYFCHTVAYPKRLIWISLISLSLTPYISSTCQQMKMMELYFRLQ